jgi:hypothetical protein
MVMLCIRLLRWEELKFYPEPAACSKLVNMQVSEVRSYASKQARYRSGWFVSGFGVYDPLLG